MVTNAADRSPDMVAANNAIAAAQQTYDTERERVLAALRAKPEYQQALTRKHDATKTVDEAKSTGKPQPELIGAATSKLDASDEVTKMEEQAVATDSSAASAKSRLSQMIADRDAMRAKMTSQVGPH